MICSAAVLLALSAAPDSAPHGRYVEARSATVFAGACHYGSEYTLAGRDAVLAVEFESGEFEGVAFAGLDLVAVVTAESNLDEAGVERRSRLHLPAAASASEQRALSRWARATLGDVLGEVTDVVATVDVQFAGADEFRVFAETASTRSAVEVRGNGLADRACCTMPFQRWYSPLVELKQSRVGFVELFRANSPELGVHQQRTDDNCALFGRL